MRLLSLTSLRFACVGVITLAGAAIIANLQADDVAPMDDFEGLTLVPFTEASGAGDGTDWTDDIRSGTAREWTIDNSQMTGVTTELAYYGFTAMDVDSWIEEQGVQVGRTGVGTVGTNNTALIADPDAWDDYTTGADTNGFTSFASRSYDLAGFTGAITIEMDYEFVTEDNQMGSIEVSFDGGTTYETLASFDSTAVANGTFFTGLPGSWTEGADFTRTSDSMTIRVGCFESGNDWWFIVDNVHVTTTDGFDDFEDFEGLTLQQFTEAGTIGDLTDWTRSIPEWTVDNSLSLGGSTEEAFDGWAAMDVFSWADEQGGQGRSLFNTPNPNNTVLVADGDAFYDYDFDLADPTQGAPSNSYNTYISRTYDISGFDACTLKFSFEYEFRIENQQLGVVEVSFDNGQTWERLEEWDDNDGANGDVLAGFSEQFAMTDFSPRQTNNVTFRFGYLDAGNNWWMAIDNVLLEADPISYVKGDANQNGTANTLDLSVFVSAFFDSAAYQAEYGVDPAVVFDFNCDGSFNSLDLSGFVNVLINGY